MKTAEELRTEAAKVREFARSVTDLEVPAELKLLIEELEHRANEMDKGGDNND